MDLFKKSFACIVILITQSVNGELSKTEQFKAMALQVRLHALASQSRGKPLPAYVQKRVGSMVSQLEQLDKKDPESHFAERAHKYEQDIVYATPVQIIEEEENEPEEEPEPVRPKKTRTESTPRVSQSDISSLKWQFGNLMNTIRAAQPTKEEIKEHENEAVSIAKHLLEAVSSQEFEKTVEDIKNLYESAIRSQVINRYWFFGGTRGAGEIEDRSKQFNEGLDAIVQELLKAKKISEQQAQEELAEEQREEALQEPEVVVSQESGAAQEKKVAQAKEKQVVAKTETPSIVSGAKAASEASVVSQEAPKPSEPELEQKQQTQEKAAQEEVAQAPAELTEEQKKENVKKYISTLNTASTEEGGNIERSGEDEPVVSARIQDDWLQKLSQVIKDNGLEYNEDMKNTVKVSLEEAFKDWNDQEKNIEKSGIINQAIQKLQQLLQQ